MLEIKTFTFNPYQENTYLIIDDNNNCIIIDPGMHTYQEENQFQQYLINKNLKPIALLNTHGHIDHVLGNNFIHETYGLIPQFHEGELPLLIQVQNYAPQMGIRYHPSPIPNTFLTDNDKIYIGDEELTIILAPGHSPAHLCFYNKNNNFLIGGDVLFNRSIGRTDLPGGNHQQLLNSISSKIYTLPEETVVYPGHGPTTTIKDEKLHNPFIRG